MLGSASNTGNENVKYLRLKIKDGLRFDVIDKDGSTQLGTETRVSGVFDGMQLKTLQSKSGDFTKINIYLKDKAIDEKYILDISPSTSLGRSIMNSMLTFEDNGAEFEVSLYEKDGFNNVALRQGGEMIKWKYAFKDLPAPSESTARGKVIKDYYDAEIKLWNELLEKFPPRENSDSEQKASGATDAELDEIFG